MAIPVIQRGSTFKGTIDLKQIVPAGSGNTFPYIIPGGAVVEIHLPPDSEATPTPITSVVLSSAVALPNPPFSTNEVVPYTDAEGGLSGLSFTCIPTKSIQLLVGNNLTVDLKVIKDPATSPSPMNVDFFEKVKVISVKDPDNA